MAVSLTDDLRREYQSVFSSCVVSPAHAGEVNTIVTRIAPNRARYEAVGSPLGIPWFVIALIHNMECSLNFNCHLHNGDPLMGRTVHVPAGRPLNGNPPFSWEQSATDALQHEGFANLSDWSLPAVLYRFEAYNGFGYRRKGIRTPYLWSFSNQYTSGKFVQDGVFDPSAVSKQCGAAVILSQMVRNGLVTFPAAAAAAPQG
jgi:lysozyme family protein